MSKFIDEIEKELNYTETENGAVALKSTLNACLDAFGSLGAMKDSPEQTIIGTFMKAFREDKKTAMRLLFYMRDIRGGQGMRRVFRTIAKYLAENKPEYIEHNLDNFLEYGRGDDILCLLDTPCKYVVLGWIKDHIISDVASASAGKPISMLAKWLPSENASSAETKKYARIIQTGIGYTPRVYRKTLSYLRNYLKVVEADMSANNWQNINYESVPSKASMNYTNAFYRHDEKRYEEYVLDAFSGNKKVNSSALFPVDIVHKCKTVRGGTINEKILDAQWKSLPNYFGDTEETGICVVDVSGSMSGTPMEVAISLGLYCADKCRGPFKGSFITFSESPELVKIDSTMTIREKYCESVRVDWGMSTNLESVFDLILDTAVRAHLSEKDMPNKLYIISDMQFNQATEGYSYHSKSTRGGTFMQSMKRKYEEHGYTMPSIVYWNVRASKCGMFQDTYGGENCCMVSGYSPSLFKAVLDGTEYVENKDGSVTAKLDPMTIMHNTLYSTRYDKVWCD